MPNRIMSRPAEQCFRGCFGEVYQETIGQFIRPLRVMGAVPSRYGRGRCSMGTCHKKASETRSQQSRQVLKAYLPTFAHGRAGGSGHERTRCWPVWSKRHTRRSRRTNYSIRADNSFGQFNGSLWERLVSLGQYKQSSPCHLKNDTSLSAMSRWQLPLKGSSGSAAKRCSV